ncbi:MULTISPECIES: family 20 glycosylhydrolase [Amycolatopsis]|uniref:beta-N-acetylhexosaminidase n=1 Tax=Amycolatopsis bullii TaxID=941987 RepID=A0ABQ3KI95_9PSEU|nr:family 20 glycosylhydrolase [Amycolatopsis bullii]GHG20925.1 beta-N-acetylhexosaminidase [Amycolatopsis bullii]
MVQSTTDRRRFRGLFLVLALVAGLVVPAAQPAVAADGIPSLARVVPAPVSVQPANGVTFELRPWSVLSYDPRLPRARQVADGFAAQLRPATGFPLPVVPAVPGLTPPGISLQLGGGEQLGGEGYRLDIGADSVRIKANRAEGLYHGVQTVRQLLPAKAERTSVQPGPWPLPGGSVTDYPRYAYRSAMLDVARHFWTVPEVKKYIDDIARYKLNYLHLHLTDDQGWRLAINGWPRLTSVGGATGVGGERGGYFTQDDYRAIVAYADAHFMTVIPEIEGPSHANAARSSYAELNCDGVAPPVFTDIYGSPYSTLCLGKEITYRFLDDVIRQVAALTPGPYLNIGGDEAKDVPKDQYRAYVQRVQAIVAKYGKKLIGWQELTGSADPARTTAQIWFPEEADSPAIADASRHGAKLIMSPAEHAYLDMKYDEDNPGYPVGQFWAGFIEVRDAYEWDPETVIPGIDVRSVIGVSAPLFTELVFERPDVDVLAFPRLPAIAELGWSPAAAHDWNSFRDRLAAQGPHWDLTGVGYYRSPQIDWPPRETR